MLDSDRPRRVVPRWRASSVAAQTAEARAAPPRRVPDVSAEIAGKQLELDLEPSVPIASELMFLAREAGNEDAAKRAARLIVKAASSIGSSRLVSIAKQVLEGVGDERLRAHGMDFIREARKRLSLDFRNPILLVDLARELTSMGKHKAALRYMRTAIALAPDSRFVVRSGARYFLHTGDHEQAHDVLRRSPILRTDPWVQAAEIAVSTVRGRTSSLVKTASRFLAERPSLGVHLAELASAVATVELQSGANKLAKKLFQSSLARPTDNSLAQAEWAAPQLKLVVDDVALSTPLSFEANSSHAYRNLQLSDAIHSAQEWAMDEPFASRPYDALSYFYCLEGRYVEAQDAAKKAIRVDGGETFDYYLNLLFTRIQTGEVDEAYQDLLRLAGMSEAKEHAVHIYANAGALAYATGEAELGKSYYMRAIQAARIRNAPSLEALARAFFARVATMYNDPNAASIVEESTRSVMLLPNPGAIYVVQSLVDEGKRRELLKTAKGRIATRKWRWDAAANTLALLE